jgi:SAM-dependent methyltransferase
MTLREDRIVRAVHERLLQEMLYELQTGGGIAFYGRPLDAAQRDLVAGARATVKALRALSRQAPAMLARYLGASGLKILDVGAGQAPWSMKLAATFPDVTITAVDLPEELDALRDAVRVAGMQDRFRLVGVDFFTSAWPADIRPGSFNLVLIANVCHLFDAARNTQLFQRVIPLLRVGGKLAIIDQVLEEDPDWRRWAPLYALGALHCAPGGQLFPVRVYTSLLAGIADWTVEVHPLCPLPPLTLITAHLNEKRPTAVHIGDSTR